MFCEAEQLGVDIHIIFELVNCSLIYILASKFLISFMNKSKIIFALYIEKRDVDFIV